MRLTHWLFPGLLLLAAPRLAAQSASTDSPAPKVETIPTGQVFGIFGHPVQDSDGMDAGRLWDVLLDGSGNPRAAVLDYGGTLGVGRRKIAVAWSIVQFKSDNPSHPIQIMLTLRELGMIPEFKYDAGPMMIGDGR